MNRKRIVIGSLIAACALAAFLVSRGSRPKAEDDSGPSLKQEAGAAARVTLSKEGGTLRADGAEFIFPKGCFTGDQSAAVVVNPRPTESVNLNQAILSPGYSLTIDSSRWSAPATVSLRFDKAKLPKGAIAADIYPVIGRGGLYERLRPQSVDLDKQLVTFAIDRSYAKVFPDGPVRPASADDFVVAADIDHLVSVGSAAGLEFFAPQTNVAKATTAVEEMSRRLIEFKGRFASMGFAVPDTISVFLVPLKGAVAGEAEGTNVIEVNLPRWETERPTLIGTLAHELFHLVQNLSYKGYGAGPGENWAIEATAEYMTYRLAPDAVKTRVKELSADFAMKGLFAFEGVATDGGQGNWQQYDAFIFFCYLDTLYDVEKIMHAMYINPAGPVDGRTGPAVEALLNDLLLKTPDNGPAHRKRNLREVYAEFLLHYCWLKDFEPLRSNFDRKLLGAPGEVLTPPRFKWQIPSSDGTFRHTLEAAEFDRSNPYSIMAAVTIANACGAGEGGDLTLTLPTVQAKDRVMMLALVSRDGKMEPQFGNADTPIVIPSWEKQTGAIVWIIDTSSTGAGPVVLQASLEPPKELLYKMSFSGRESGYEPIGAEIVHISEQGDSTITGYCDYMGHDSDHLIHLRYKLQGKIEPDGRITLALRDGITEFSDPTGPFKTVKTQHISGTFVGWRRTPRPPDMPGWQGTRELAAAKGYSASVSNLIVQSSEARQPTLQEESELAGKPFTRGHDWTVEDGGWYMNLVAPAAEQDGSSPLAGAWECAAGRLELKQNGTVVYGHMTRGSGMTTVMHDGGWLAKTRALKFQWRIGGAAAGYGELVLSEDGQQLTGSDTVGKKTTQIVLHRAAPPVNGG